MLIAQETKIQVGDIFDTNNCGKLVVLEYKGHLDVIVKFIDTGYETTARANNLRKGNVKDRSLPSVYGVGIIGELPISHGGKHDKEYVFWKSMLERCYDEKYSNKYPTYKDCEVSDNFKYLPYFEEWCHQQTGFDQECWHLDKDILIKRNKVYSENTCCFVPAEINGLFIKRDARRGNLPIGVKWCRRDKVFISSACLHGKSKHLGSFDNAICAFLAYKQAKEAYIKEVAEKWKDQIDPRVYEALMNYEVEIND